jgi:uncharacterized membrane protein YidH (DUF202 family)
MTALVRLPTDKRRRLAQAGLISRGVLYCLVGILAFQVAFGGASSKQATQSGALQTLAQQPGGTLLVALVGVGLVAYAAWRFTQFFTEKGSEDSDAKDAVMRASYVVRAVIYMALAFLAFRLVFGGGGGGGNTQVTLTARIMKDVPGGVFLIGLVGIIIIGVGIYQAYKAFTTDFMEELHQQQLSPAERTWIKRIGVAGHLARAIVYTLIGIFVVRAAVEFDPQKASGLDVALEELAQSAGGPWILAAVALGLILFGVYAIVRARYVDVSE